MLDNLKLRLGRILKGFPPKGGVGSGASIRSGIWETEKAPDLSTSQKRAENFLRAYKTDSRVSQAVDEHLASLSTGTWSVEPGDDTPEGKDAADYVSAVLFGNESDKYGRDFWVRPVWPQRRYELGFSLLVYGYALYHKVYKVIEGKTTLDKLTFIEPSTITLWQLDAKDDLELIQRSYTKGDDTQVINEEILAKDLVLYTHRLVGANYEGISLVRTIYPAFARKEFLEKMKMIAAKRLFAAIPVLKVAADIRPGSQAWIELERFMQSLTNPNVDTSYLMATELPEWLQAASVESLTELANWLKDENAEIAAGGGSKAMLSGETNSGSRSANNTMDARETVRHNALAEDIVTLENFGIAGLPSLITELVSINFPTVKIMPYVVYKESGTAEALKKASVWADLVSKQVLHQFPEDEMQVREACGFDDSITLEQIKTAFAKDEADKQAALDAKANAPQDQPPKETPNAVKPTEGQEQ